MNFQIIQNFSLKEINTYHIGGTTKYFYIAENIYDLLEVLEWVRREGIYWFCIGKGSNLLISDTGFPGIVIKLGNGFSHIKISENTALVSTGGGCPLIKLGMTLINQGWAGFEYMCVIPGTVGAAVRINAGTQEGEIKDKLLSAEVLMPNLEIVNCTVDFFEFSYRYSKIVENQGIVINANFMIEDKEKPENIKKRVQEIALRRKLRQPQNPRNCGSVFKNPTGGKSAGWYIEQTGLKGMRIGDAQIANEHANWIVNLGNATSTDVKNLIHHVQEKVFKKFNIELQREVMYVPEDII